MTWRHSLLLMVCAAALLGSRGSDLEAQVIQLRPVADFSFPTRFSFKDGGIQVRQKVTLRVGGRMTMTFSDRFDVVTAVTYSPGSATLHGGGSRIDFSSSAHSLAGSTGARYWVLPPPRTLAREFHTSVGMVFGGVPAYGDLFERSTLSGVVGTTLLYQIGQIVTLKLRVNQRLYRVHFGGGDGRGSKPLQVSFGLGFPFLESLRQKRDSMNTE